ncbi:hypothetical protein pdam_00008127 [Pocillopora damicornis]|uniref:Uncharacterized protein n=1 Tax=Pocillopora damicornis TaxID=46731 RepID=A0A3M6UDC5_POCDA|nr:interaptin-like [Pocillopora damicornis]RMX51687.1 hypothetical protein pdam_00008127 [Pocillopora damicornis]
MSRMRTGLRPTVPTRHSPTKFPPVSNGLRSSSLPGSANSREPEWANDMVRGIQLKTASKTPLVAAHSPRKTPVGLEEVKATTSVKQHGEMTFSSSQQSMRESAKDKEIEKLKLKILSLQKLIEQLRAEIKEKTHKITELEEKLKSQEADFEEKINKVKAIISEKEKELNEKTKVIKNKDLAINELKDSFQKEKEDITKQYELELNKLKEQHLQELTERDGKMKILKMHMADALKDNSRERQVQLEELTKELKRVTEETDVLKSKLQSMKSSNQGKCPNCFVMERQLQSKILELRDKEVVTIEMQQLCAKMEQQLVQQDQLLRQWAKNKGKPVR